MQGVARDSASARREWREGWPLVIASTGGMSVGPIMTYSMGLFVASLEAEMGWTRAMIMSGLTINGIMGVIFAAGAGLLVDRFGPRVIAVPGIAIFCIFFALLSTTTNSIVHWWILWSGISIGAVMLKPMIWTYAVVSRFDSARGLALALTLSGSAITGTVAPFLADHFIQTLGWRQAYVALAAVYCIIVLPLVILCFRSARELGDRKGAGAKASRGAALTGLSIREGLSSLVYWRITLGTFMILIVIIGCVVHLVPILTELGLDRSHAVAAAGLLGGTAFGGRLLSGYLLDRIDARLLGGIAFLVPAFVCALLLTAGTQASVALAFATVALLGLCTGAELEVSSYLSSKHFGLRSFGTLFGIIAGLIALANGVGPALAGLAFDTFQSYDVALSAGIGLSVLASLLIFTLPPYPPSFGAAVPE